MKALCATAVLAASIFMLSCSKVGQGSDISSQETSLSVTLNGLGEPATKVAGSQATNEKTVKNVQVFIFNTATGKIDNSFYQSGMDVSSGSFSLPAIQCTVGPRTVWVVVNGPRNYTEDENINSLDKLKSITVSLSDNSVDALMMVGSASKTLAAGNDAVGVDVSRLVSAVVLESVSNEMLSEAYKDKVYITGAYLMNVPGVQKLDGSIASEGSESPASSWFSWYAKASGQQPVALLSESISPVKINYGSPYTEPHTFYSFSNNYSAVEGVDSKNAKTSTYLVVECSIDGQACIYPVLLPALVANIKYKVSLTIKHIGSDPDEPWKKIKFSDTVPTITVLPWTESPYNETI